MGRSANVTSIEAIQAMRVALRKFEAGARDGLEMLVLEVRRAVDWIENDRRRYWPAQVRRASERLVEARNELDRCQLTYGSEESPSCYDQQQAFDRAKRRLRWCEEKVKVTNRWARVIQHEVGEFEGQVAQLNNVLDNDVPRAVAALERMVRALDRYATTQHVNQVAPTDDENDVGENDVGEEQAKSGQ